MTDDRSIDRRGLGRALSRIMDASVETALAGLVEPPERGIRRVGFTGSPGAGKSTLIGHYAKNRAERDRNVGILMVDPTSPVSGGALLGDRIRLDAIAGHPRVFIRSVASRNAHDGLCDNAPDLLLAMEAFGFGELVLETVGVGQVEHAVEALVDTLVLVLMPESGDAIQAMKAGLLEKAHILVINKADLPGADRTRAEVSWILKHRRQSNGGWTPQLVLTSDKDGRGIVELVEAIDHHRMWLEQHADRREILRRRRDYHLNSLIARRVREVISELGDDLLDVKLADAFAEVARGIVELEHAPPTGEGRRDD